MFPDMPEETFEQWVSNRFGKRLYRHFLQDVHREGLGHPMQRNSAEWAAQRIKGLSLLTAVKNALLIPTAVTRASHQDTDRSFDYPAKGPGMMWEAVHRLVEAEAASSPKTAVDRIRWVRESHRAQVADRWMTRAFPVRTSSAACRCGS